MNTRSLLLSTLIGGLATAILANFPLLACLNVVLCLWAWAGGALAVVMYRRFENGRPATIGQGAGLGAIAGVIGAVVGSIIGLFVGAIVTPMMQAMMQGLQGSGGSAPGFSMLTGVVGSAFSFAFQIVLYPLFGAIAGLITASLMAPKIAPPPPVPPVPPLPPVGPA